MTTPLTGLHTINKCSFLILTLMNLLVKKCPTKHKDKSIPYSAYGSKLISRSTSFSSIVRFSMFGGSMVNDQEDS